MNLHSATNLEVKMDDSTTVLILTARHELLDLLHHLIKAGVKVNTADNQGMFWIPDLICCLFKKNLEMDLSVHV